MAALFAATIHDVDHPGLTNQFLINSSKYTAQFSRSAIFFLKKLHIKIIADKKYDDTNNI